jgi:hypothetical protein
MASSSNHVFNYIGNGLSYSSSSDDQIFKQLFVDVDRQKQCAFACVVVVANSFDMLNANELKEGIG